jgi:hypothetical protein
MLKETWETRKENDPIRMEIIRAVMQISTTERLKLILSFAKRANDKESADRPMDIMEIAGMLDFADVVRVLDAISKADMAQLAARQMKETFSQALDCWTEAE